MYNPRQISLSNLGGGMVMYITHVNVAGKVVTEDALLVLKICKKTLEKVRPDTRCTTAWSKPVKPLFLY
jgi:hypothetical protein